MTPPWDHPAQRGVAVPAEKTWGEGKDEDDRFKYSGRQENDVPVRNIDPGENQADWRKTPG